jgi:hypothetical protein
LQKNVRALLSAKKFLNLIEPLARLAQNEERRCTGSEARGEEDWGK